MIHRLNLPDLAAIFEQQNSSPKEQFAIFACGLVCARVPGFHWIDLTAALQYNISSEGGGFHGDRLRALPDPIPARDEIIPSPDSDPSSVLNHPFGNEHKIDFAAYDPPTPMVSSPVDGPDAV